LVRVADSGFSQKQFGRQKAQNAQDKTPLLNVFVPAQPACCPAGMLAGNLRESSRRKNILN
jgi:hypothetical protein